MSVEVRVPSARLAGGRSRAERVEHDGIAVCVARIDDRYFAIGDRCSHADVSLAAGDIDADECVIECLRHGSAFSLVDGEPQSLPALVGVPVYGVRLEGADVVVTLR